MHEKILVVHDSLNIAALAGRVLAEWRITVTTTGPGAGAASPRLARSAASSRSTPIDTPVAGTSCPVKRLTRSS